MDELIYILSGKAEQWLKQESKMLDPHEAVFVPQNMVHATFNAGKEPLVILVILSPAKNLDESGMVDVSGEEPWSYLKKS